jgi:hypothetical protein
MLAQVAKCGLEILGEMKSPSIELYVFVECWISPGAGESFIRWRIREPGML